MHDKPLHADSDLFAGHAQHTRDRRNKYAQGGKVSIDPIGNLRNIVPDAWFYIWKDKDAAFVNGSVHAKVAVADGLFCFITSANLTGYAMDQNMEAGVLISGVPLPEQLHRHLEALVITGVIVPIG